MAYTTKIENIYLLDEQYHALGIFNPNLPGGCPFKNDVYQQRLEHGFRTLDFEIPAGHRLAKEVVMERYIVYPDLDGYKLLFKIKQVTENDANGQYIKKVFCENSAVSDLLGNIVRPAKLNSYTLEDALNYVLQGTTWELGEVEYSDIRDITFDDYITSLEALHQVLDAYEAEIEFHVNFDGLVASRKAVDVLQRLGNDIYIPFEYGLNLTEVERQGDTQELVTALIGVGKGDTEAQALTFASYNPTIDTSKYEKQTDWVGSLEALQRWGINGKHRLGVYRDDTAQNAVELFDRTLVELDRLSKPRFTYKVDVILLEDLLSLEAFTVRLGDRVVIKDFTFQPELLLEARIIEYKHSLADPKSNQVTLGEFEPIPFVTNSRIEQIRNRLDRSETAWNVARKSSGTGAHVVANSPTPLVDGDYAQATHSLIVNVDENVHLGYVSVFCQTAGQTGNVKLIDNSTFTVIYERSFTGLVSGENKLHLDFLLLQEAGEYLLLGSFSGNTWRTTTGLVFPYISGSFRVINSTDSNGYWNHFYNLVIGGSQASGGYGSKLSLGDASNRLGNFDIKDSNGETILVADNGQITMDKAVIAEIDSPSVPNIATFDSLQTYYVNATTGDDDNNGLATGTPFKTIYKALSILPRIFDGEVRIEIESNLSEDILISGFLGDGRLYLDFNTYTITGTVKVSGAKIRVDILAATINYKLGETSAPVQVYKSDYVFMQDCNVRGKTGTGGTTACVQVFDGSFAYFLNCKFYQSITACIRVAYGARAVVHGCQGYNASYGLVAEYAGFIGVRETYPNGTTGDINFGFGGQVVKHQTGTSADPGTTQTPPTPPTTTTWNSSEGDSYRTVYNSWRNDGTVRQGQFENNGNHTGCWFFGSGPSTTVTGKTISKIRIYLKRLGTSGNDSTTVTIRGHTHTSQPGGSPTLTSNVALLNVTFKRGEGKWITLPSSFHSQFNAGTAKGMGLFTGSSGTSAYYASFDDSARIEITYT